MPIRARKLDFPRLNGIWETINLSQFTDGGSTVGTYQMAGTVPQGAVIQYTRVRIPKAFLGDTSATLTIGDGSDVDRYNTGTPSVFTVAAAAGVDMGAPSGVKTLLADNRPTLTVTSGSDFTLVTQGQLEVEIAFLEFHEGRGGPL